MWKKMNEHFFGELSSKNVDVTQTFDWKPLFISLRKADWWSKTFPSTSLTFEVPKEQVKVLNGPIELGTSGQYLHTRTYSVNVKTAGKLVHMKKDPLVQQDREWLVPRVKYPQEGWNLAFNESNHTLLASDGKGKFLVEGNKRWNVYDSEQVATLSPADHRATLCGEISKADSKSTPWDEFPEYLGSFNSRFAVVADKKRFYRQRPIKHEIFDFESTCDHVIPCFKDNSKDVVWNRNREEERKWRGYRWASYYRYKVTEDEKLACKDHTINTPFGVLGVFASQLVPEKIVFMLREADQEKSVGQYVCYPKLAVWKHGEGLNETECIHFKHEKEFLAKNFSEHVIDGYHWLCFDMGQHTRIINLNNFANQFKLDRIEKRMWIPNKNKIVLVSGKKLTVLDLHLNRWTSRMTCPNDVRAMTFNKSTRLLFVADSQFVHALHWETAKLIGSTFHPLAQTKEVVHAVHVAYDQVLIINGTHFMKMPIKCDI